MGCVLSHMGHVLSHWVTCYHIWVCSHRCSVLKAYLGRRTACEAHAYGMHAHEVHACEMHVYEVHAMRCTPVRCTPMRCTPVRYTFIPSPVTLLHLSVALILRVRPLTRF